jgi:hypothetical protein
MLGLRENQNMFWSDLYVIWKALNDTTNLDIAPSIHRMCFVLTNQINVFSPFSLAVVSISLPYLIWTLAIVS